MARYSSGSFDPDMKFTVRFIIAGACAGLFLAQIATAEVAREQLSLDANWKFHLGDIPLNSFPGGQGVVLYGPHITDSGSKAGCVWGAAARGYDDRNWRTVNLPHDWAVEQVFDSKAEKQQDDTSVNCCRHL